MSVDLTPGVPSPVPVGTPVVWDASASEASPGTLWYRFRVRAPGGEFRVVSDYGPVNHITWAPAEVEGSYEMEVSVRNRDTGETADTITPYAVTSRVTGDTPVITPLSNPLVYLYSAPPCPRGSRMRVEFSDPAGGGWQSTNVKNCADASSMNFYVAGLRSNTAYTVRHVVQTGDVSVQGPALTFQTAEVKLPSAAVNVLEKPSIAERQGVLLQSTIFQFPFATDMDGQIIWYYAAEITYITRPSAGGYFFVLAGTPGGEPSQQLVRKVDLAGNTVWETNAARVSEKLEAMGKRPITGFHHEATRLPDGKIMVLASTEQVFYNVQGAGAKDVLGDMILILDEKSLDVLWTWDAFDHLNVNRAAVLGETCTPVGGGCPPFHLAPIANDWLHGNALQFAPDGNIIYSARHQDWIVKIEYLYGRGNGSVLWRLGKDGDFTMTSDDPYPWFSHQHDPGYERTGGFGILRLFDNGNTRVEETGEGNSRGQVLKLDEVNLTATLVLNVDLGAYSYALGSAQRLTNGNYHFELGLLPDGLSRAVEVDLSANVVSVVETGTAQYRSFRMRDLYTP